MPTDAKSTVEKLTEAYQLLHKADQLLSSDFRVTHPVRCQIQRALTQMTRHYQALAWSAKTPEEREAAAEHATQLLSKMFGPVTPDNSKPEPTEAGQARFEAILADAQSRRQGRLLI